MSFNIIYADDISSNINSLIFQELEKNNFPQLDRSIENVNSSGFFRWPRSNPFCSLKYYFNADLSVAVIASNFKTGKEVRLLFKRKEEKPKDVISLWDGAQSMASLHPYLEQKGFTLEDLRPIMQNPFFFGLKVDEKKNLLIPYTTASGVLEWIEVRGSGGFRGARGSKKEGLFRLNEHFDGGEDIYLCEGPATALSLAVELRSPVYGCGSRLQLVSAARSLKEQFDGANIIVCLDMDKPHVVMQMQEVFKSLDIATCLPLPDFSREDGFDFNDLMQWERAHG